MTDTTNARLDRLEATLKALLGGEGPTYRRDIWRRCVFCDVETETGVRQHFQDCSYTAAQAALRTPVDPTPPAVETKPVIEIGDRVRGPMTEHGDFLQEGVVVAVDEPVSEYCIKDDGGLLWLISARRAALLEKGQGNPNAKD